MQAEARRRESLRTRKEREAVRREDREKIPKISKTGSEHGLHEKGLREKWRNALEVRRAREKRFFERTKNRKRARRERKKILDFSLDDNGCNIASRLDDRRKNSRCTSLNILVRSKPTDNVAREKGEGEEYKTRRRSQVMMQVYCDMRAEHQRGSHPTHSTA